MLIGHQLIGLLNFANLAKLALYPILKQLVTLPRILPPVTPKSLIRIHTLFSLSTSRKDRLQMLNQIAEAGNLLRHIRLADLHERDGQSIFHVADIDSL